MNPVSITALLWPALAVFLLSAVAIGHLHRRLPPSRGTHLIARLLQACCGIGALVCVAGLVLNQLR